MSEKIFKQLELNERNVNTLFKRCLPDEEELKSRSFLKNAQVLIPQICGKESENALFWRLHYPGLYF